MMKAIICLPILLVFVSIFTTKSFAQADRFNPGVVKNPNRNEEAVVLLLLDEGKGNKAIDSSDLGNNGVLKGGVDWKKGKFGMAVELGPGKAGFQRIEIPPHDSHALHAMTVMAWVSIDGKVGNDSFIIDKSCWDCAAALPRNFSLWDHHPNGRDSVLNFGWRDNGDLGGGGDRVANSPPAEHIHDGTWRHVGGSYDGKNIRVYIDGIVQWVRNFPSKPGDGQAPAYLNAPIVIGALGPAGTGHGLPRGTMIDEIGIFSYALDEKQIKTAMEDGLARTFVLAVNPRDKLATTWANIKKH